MKACASSSEPPPDLHRLLADSLKLQWKRYRKMLKECQRKFSKAAVHDLRVGLRRLLSTVELLDTFVHERQIKKARKLLRKHLDAFTELRDIQVQLLLVGLWRKRRVAVRGFHDHLRQRERRCIEQVRRKARRIKTARLGRLIKHFCGELRDRRKQGLAAQDRATVLRATDRAFAAAARSQQLINPADLATIHRTRIAFKKFRYMVEALAPLWPSMTEARLITLHDYQTLMGDIQDSEVQLASFSRFLKEERPARAASNSLRAELLRRQQRLIQIYLKAADQLHDFWPTPDMSPDKTEVKKRRKF